jgi:hypothetical protein
MMGLLALTRQKQLTKSRQAASQPASQRWVCLFQDSLSRKNSHSAKMSSKFFRDKIEMGPQETTYKNKILLYGHLLMPLEA